MSVKIGHMFWKYARVHAPLSAIFSDLLKNNLFKPPLRAILLDMLSFLVILQKDTYSKRTLKYACAIAIIRK